MLGPILSGEPALNGSTDDALSGNRSVCTSSVSNTAGLSPECAYSFGIFLTGVLLIPELIDFRSSTNDCTESTLTDWSVDVAVTVIVLWLCDLCGRFGTYEL